MAIDSQGKEFSPVKEQTTSLPSFGYHTFTKSGRFALIGAVSGVILQTVYQSAQPIYELTKNNLANNLQFYGSWDQFMNTLVYGGAGVLMGLAWKGINWVDIKGLGVFHGARRVAGENSEVNQASRSLERKIAIARKEGDAHVELAKIQHDTQKRVSKYRTPESEMQ